MRPSLNICTLPFAKLNTFWIWQIVQIVCSNKVWPVWNCYSKYMPGNSTKVFSSDRSIQKLEASSIGRRRKIPICISWNPKNWGTWNVYYGKFNCRVSRQNVLEPKFFNKWIKSIYFNNHIFNLSKVHSDDNFSPFALKSHKAILDILKKTDFQVWKICNWNHHAAHQLEKSSSFIVSAKGRILNFCW